MLKSFRCRHRQCGDSESDIEWGGRPVWKVERWAKVRNTWFAQFFNNDHLCLELRGTSDTLALSVGRLETWAEVRNILFEGEVVTYLFAQSDSWHSHSEADWIIVSGMHFLTALCDSVWWESAGFQSIVLHPLHCREWNDQGMCQLSLGRSISRRVSISLKCLRMFSI